MPITSILRPILKWAASVVWWTLGFWYKWILVPLWKWAKWVLRDIAAKKIIWAPIAWSRKKLWQWANWLWRKWSSVINHSQSAIKNVFNTWTAKTSDLASKTWSLIADTLKATVAAPWKAINHVIDSTKEWIELIFNLPEHLWNSAPVKATKDGINSVMWLFDSKPKAA